MAEDVIQLICRAINREHGIVTFQTAGLTSPCPKTHISNFFKLFAEPANIGASFSYPAMQRSKVTDSRAQVAGGI